jgi:hypothetical protein
LRRFFFIPTLSLPKGREPFGDHRPKGRAEPLITKGVI